MGAARFRQDHARQAARQRRLRRRASVDAGRSIIYRRVDDYWAKDLPVNVGRSNFGAIRYDYYRDATIALEAFKAGQYDIRIENVAKNWAIGYAGPRSRPA